MGSTQARLLIFTGEELIQQIDGMMSMLVKINGNVATQECTHCKKTNEMDVTNIEMDFNEEFNEYHNFTFQCECGAVEIFNTNLNPEPEENDDDYRTLAKKFMSLVRKDLKNL